MARRVQHSSHEPRVEMTPLLDVIFLLLTFFIYSMIVTVRAEFIPVNLPQLTTGEIIGDIDIAAISVDSRGQFFLNRKPITRSELETQLRELGRRAKPPRFFVAMDNERGEIDRAPDVFELIQIFRRAGVENVNFVGQPREKPAP